jgi:hypothetical protein
MNISLHHYSSSHATKRNANFSLHTISHWLVFNLSAKVSGFAKSNLLCLRDEVGEAVLESLAVLVGCVLGEAVNRSCQPTIQFTTRR